jgi:hypothetical protein
MNHTVQKQGSGVWWSRKTKNKKNHKKYKRTKILEPQQSTPITQKRANFQSITEKHMEKFSSIFGHLYTLIMPPQKLEARYVYKMPPMPTKAGFSVGQDASHSYRVFITNYLGL